MAYTYRLWYLTQCKLIQYYSQSCSRAQGGNLHTWRFEHRMLGSGGQHPSWREFPLPADPKASRCVLCEPCSWRWSDCWSSHKSCLCLLHQHSICRGAEKIAVYSQGRKEVLHQHSEQFKPRLLTNLEIKIYIFNFEPLLALSKSASKEFKSPSHVMHCVCAC